MARASAASMPDDLSPRHLRKRVLQLSGLVVFVILAIWLLPGLGEVRSRLRHASAGWLVLGLVFELCSALSYVVVFRSVFCPRMSWKLSYQIGMSEQAANSLLPAGGAGGLALGAWALSRGGTPAEHIARRTIAFFLLTSLANVAVLIVFAAGSAIGIVGPTTRLAVTLGFAGAGLVGVIVTLELPALTARYSHRLQGTASDGRIRMLAKRGARALGDGVRDAVELLRQRSVGVIGGSLGYLAFDIAVLGVCYRAFGDSPSLGVLVVAYVIGQLGGLLPIPGGIGGVEGGLIGVFVLYNAPLATTTVAVLTYRAIQLWLPAVLGSIAFVRLRNTLRREDQPAVMCQPLAEQIELRRPSAAAG